jgi:putative transposase
VFLEHGTRRRHAGGVTASPAGERTVPHARTPGRRVEDIRFLPRGRGPNFTASFEALFPATGTTILISAVQAPRLNATRERLTGTPRREVPDRIPIPGEGHLRAVLTGYQAHDNTAGRTTASPRASPARNLTSPAPPRPTSTDNKSADNPSRAARSTSTPTLPDARRPAGHLPNPIFERDRRAWPAASAP